MHYSGWRHAQKTPVFMRYVTSAWLPSWVPHVTSTAYWNFSYLFTSPALRSQTSRRQRAGTGPRSALTGKGKFYQGWNGVWSFSKCSSCVCPTLLQLQCCFRQRFCPFNLLYVGLELWVRIRILKQKAASKLQLHFLKTILYFEKI